MASIWGFIACPNGVLRNSAGSPATTVIPLLFAAPSPNELSLTADPTRYLPPRQKPHNIRRKVITIELDQMVRRGRIRFPQRGQVLLERRLVDLSLAAIDDLLGLTMVRRARTGFEDALAEEDLAAEYYYGGVPVSSARTFMYMRDRPGAHQIPSICLPVNIRLMFLAKPFDRS
jgi:hypothetical protein